MDKNSKITISVIVPIFNTQKYLSDCLDSIINQSLKNIEIILVNDGSTDGSAEIIEAYKKKDPRITAIYQENSGLSGARNTGIDAAKGDYLSFIDSDDEIATYMLEKMYKEVIKNKSEIVQCRYKKQNKGQSSEQNDSYVSTCHLNVDALDMFKNVLACKASTMACDKIFKRELFTDNKIYFPLGIMHEDVATIYKVFHFAKTYSAVDYIGYFWNIREGSISQTVSKAHIQNFFMIFEDTKKFLIKNEIYELYEWCYLRRCYHFSLGVFERIVKCKSPDLNITSAVESVFSKLDENGLGDKNQYMRLRTIDQKLFDRFALWRAYYDYDGHIDAAAYDLAVMQQQLYDIKNSAAYRLALMIKKVAVKIAPPGGKFRDIIRYFLYKKDKYKPETERVKTTMPMLASNERITQTEKLKIQNLKDKFKGKRCVIIGNGPSLNKCDLSLLKNEYTFGVNGIFYKTHSSGFRPSFYMVEDGHVIDDNLSQINNYEIKYKFFPSLYREKITSSDNNYFFSADLGFYRSNHSHYESPRFSKEFSETAYCGQSVTFLNMQLAYYLGFTEVHLIGMDFSYQIRKSDQKHGQTLISNEDDVNHFHPDYFGKGKKWHDPKVHNVKVCYEYAKEVFLSSNRNIYNASVGGKLEVFPRVNYGDVFGKVR